jgi:hypothetical protein
MSKTAVLIELVVAVVVLGVLVILAALLWNMGLE